MQKAPVYLVFNYGEDVSKQPKVSGVEQVEKAVERVGKEFGMLKISWKAVEMDQITDDLFLMTVDWHLIFFI